MSTILQRLEHEPSYCLQSDEKQLRRDAAEELRRAHAFIERLLSPEEFGHAVTAEVRDEARAVLGIPKCETAA